MMFPVSSNYSGPEVEKFISLVDGSNWSIDECWEWLGYKTNRGYGLFHPAKRKHIRAHRYALQLYLGRTLEAFALHKCDNRSCVNPHHPYEGSQGRNMRDMVLRGRSQWGERSIRAKITFNEAIAPALLFRSGHSLSKIAEFFELNPATIHCVACGKNWIEAHDVVDLIEPIGVTGTHQQPGTSKN